MNYFVEANRLFVEVDGKKTLIRQFPNKIYSHTILPTGEIVVCLYWEPTPVGGTNVYCLCPDGTAKWQIQHSIQTPTFMNKPYAYVVAKDGKLLADDIHGSEYEVDVESGRVKVIGASRF